jgi:molybdenum cofactor cytidylyltransferase
MIWAVVLAAGESLRMGTQKLVLPFGGRTVIESVVTAALDSAADRTLVVLGADQDKVRRILSPYPVKFAVNGEFHLGMLSSIQTGFRAVPHEARAIVIMLGDQPAIPAPVVDEVIGTYRRRGRGIVVPVFAGRRGHPVLVEARYREEVLGLDPEVGLRQLLRAHPDDVAEVDASTEAVLRDMDRPEDYAAEKGTPGPVKK